MYSFLAFLTGIVLEIMIAVNGSLTERHGEIAAVIIIHIVGTLFAALLCFRQKEKKPLWRQGPVWFYLGGVIGVATTMCNNFAFGKISITSISALDLLGQTVTGLVIDSLGLFGMERRPLRTTSLWGLSFSLCGIAVMMGGTTSAELLPIVLSLAAGVSVVLSRTVNARLSGRVGALAGSFLNHLVGLATTVCLLPILLAANPAGAALSDGASSAVAALSGGVSSAAAALSDGASATAALSGGISAARPWIYCGGMLGVTVVALSNLTVPRISAFRITALSFVGQVFAGILFDTVIGSDYPPASFYGGLIIAAGIAVNMILEQAEQRRIRKERETYTRIREMEREYQISLIEKHFIS